MSDPQTDAFTATALASELRYRLACQTTLYWRDLTIAITEPVPGFANLEVSYGGRSVALLENLQALQTKRDRGIYAPQMELVIRDIISILDLPRSATLMP